MDITLLDSLIKDEVIEEKEINQLISSMKPLFPRIIWEKVIDSAKQEENIHNLTPLTINKSFFILEFNRLKDNFLLVDKDNKEIFNIYKELLTILFEVTEQHSGEIILRDINRFLSVFPKTIQCIRAVFDIIDAYSYTIESEMKIKIDYKFFINKGKLTINSIGKSLKRQFILTGEVFSNSIKNLKKFDSNSILITPDIFNELEHDHYLQSKFSSFEESFYIYNFLS